MEGPGHAKQRRLTDASSIFGTWPTLENCMRRFGDKVITVTGATSGLGRNAAVAFAAAGAKVVAAAIEVVRRAAGGHRQAEGSVRPPGGAKATGIRVLLARVGNVRPGERVVAIVIVEGRVEG